MFLAVGVLLIITSLNVAVISAISPNQQSFPFHTIQLHDGFKIELFASGLPLARMMALGDNGTLFVSTRGIGSEGNVFAIPNATTSTSASEIITIASGLDVPGGVAFYNGALYVATKPYVLRYNDIENNLYSPPAPVVVDDTVPTAHGPKTLRLGPDDKLYAKVGAPCNVCENNDPFATIVRMNPDGTGIEVFARGIRNAVGFDWHPLTGELWFTNNGRDNLGDDLPPETLNHAPVAGLNFGFPYCHAGYISDPEFGHLHACNEFEPPAQLLPAHVAPLGMRFYDGTGFPAEYHNQIFIAEHGSWNRSTKIGYRVSLVRLDGSGDPVSYEVFAEGWLNPDQSVWGRPVDIQVMPDGAILVSDDYAGAIYRISYQCGHPAPAAAEFSEQEIQQHLETQIAAQGQDVEFALVDLVPCGIQATVRTTDQNVGNVLVSMMPSSTGSVTMTTGEITMLDGSPAPDAFITAINREFVPLLLDTLDAAFTARVGANHDVENIIITPQSLAVTFQ